MYALDVVTKSIFCYGIDIKETLRKCVGAMFKGSRGRWQNN
jgi:hypothetical protein